MNMNYFTLELQRESADFSDAKTVAEFSDIQVAMAHLIDDTKGHRRLIGWLDLGAMQAPVELIRL
jgi:hypothetical protein